MFTIGKRELSESWGVGLGAGAGVWICSICSRAGAIASAMGVGAWRQPEMVMMPTIATRTILGSVWLMKLKMDGRRRTGIQRNIGKMGSGGKGRERGRTCDSY